MTATTDDAGESGPGRARPVGPDRSPVSPPVDRRRYLRGVRRRMGTADTAALLRAGGIQTVWLVVLVAGAAIPLGEAVFPGRAPWLSPVLGFVVVVAAGLERIFTRTTDAAVALDGLRRALGREHRSMLAGCDAYAATDDPVGLFASRAEDLISRYDESMVAYSAALVRPPQQTGGAGS